jgi:predicted nuclease of restriction endonuclease-like (RecB) superfamily
MTDKQVKKESPFSTDALFGRVAAIVESARDRVVRTVNITTVTTYWLIGRELVEAIQQGEQRAGYGKALISRLAERLTECYGKGFSSTNLAYFRQFYLAYPERIHIPATGESLGLALDEIFRPVGGKFPTNVKANILYPLRRESAPTFHPNLSWSHYRALMRVTDSDARNFYESEAAQANWSRRDLERQIHSLYYQRLLASVDRPAMLQAQRQPQQPLRPIDMLKDPYVLEFLDLPSSPQLQEAQLEESIIGRLQQFLLELGRGFAFVARQQRLRFDDKDFYVDLVFYNYLLKCFVLVDLKIGELTHQDIGQMDGYVRMYEERHRVADDNPTIGLILCSEKNTAVARYSVLRDSQQLFASRYRLTLPSEEELRNELQRERALLENQMEPMGKQP